MKVHAWFAAGLASLLMAATGAQAGTIILTDLTEGGTATAFPADFPAAESPDRAFDNNRTTKGLIWNDYNGNLNNDGEDVTAANPVMWTYDFPAAVTVRSYSLTSANDAQARDARDFFLEGSNDGNIWTTVDTVTGHVFEDQPNVGDQTLPPPGTQNQNRYETYFFNVDSPASFDQYRLRVIETFGATDDRPQMAEIQMFDTIVPEPGSLGLLGLAAVGMLRRRARR